MSDTPKSEAGMEQFWKMWKATDKAPIEDAERTHLSELLGQAIDLFEMEPDCDEIGSDAWVWLHQAREVLGR